MAKDKQPELKITKDLRDRLQRALAEDVGSCDITTESIIEGPTPGRAVIIAREQGIVCGLPVVEEVLRLAGRRMRMKRLCREGDRVVRGDGVFEVRGAMAGILTGERLALNFLQRLSGVASLTARYVAALGDKKTEILDTRKTTPLWRDLEKYAVRVGGGVNHRFGLYDAVLIKNNHADAAGSLTEAIRRAKKATRRRRKIQLMAEARDLGEVREAVAGQVDVLLLDNFTAAGMRRALREIPSSIATEASGGITVRRVRTLAGLGLDRISVGALTHSAPAMDFALRYRKP